MASRPARGRWTFGFRRLEILAAQANGLALAPVGLAAFVWTVTSGFPALSAHVLVE